MEYQLEIWDGAEYQPYQTGDDPSELTKSYRAVQWMDQATWREAFPGRSRAFRIVDVGQGRATRLPGLRRSRRSLGNGIEVAAQAKVYAEHLVKVHGRCEVPFYAWSACQGKYGHRTTAYKALKALASALRDLGVQGWTVKYVDPDEQCHEILDDERFDEVRFPEGAPA